MEIIDSLSEDEKALVLESGVPDFPQCDFDIDEIQFVMSSISDKVQPLASYVLNRMAVWLEADGVRWGGDEAIEATWSGEGAERRCTLTKRDGGDAWIVDWHPKWFKPETTEISLTRVDASGEEHEIARGDFADEHSTRTPKSRKGAVEGQIRLAAFDDLCAFAGAVASSVPSTLLKTTPDFVSFLPYVNIVHAARLEDIQPLMEADGGLPGRLCQAWVAYTVAAIGKSVGAWMRSKYLPLVEGLRGVEAEWGKGVVSYNDGDYLCCAVDFSDGSFGLFSDNAATGEDKHAYVARLEVENGIVTSVDVHALDNEEDYHARVVAIGNGTTSPDFAYDYKSMMPSFPGGRDGWTAMSLLYWQFVTDANYALEEPNVNMDGHYWKSRSDDAAMNA